MEKAAVVDMLKLHENKVVNIKVGSGPGEIVSKVIYIFDDVDISDTRAALAFFQPEREYIYIDYNHTPLQITRVDIDAEIEGQGIEERELDNKISELNKVLDSKRAVEGKLKELADHYSNCEPKRERFLRRRVNKPPMNGGGDDELDPGLAEQREAVLSRINKPESNSDSSGLGDEELDPGLAEQREAVLSRINKPESKSDSSGLGASIQKIRDYNSLVERIQEKKNSFAQLNVRVGNFGGVEGIKKLQEEIKEKILEYTENIEKYCQPLGGGGRSKRSKRSKRTKI